MVLDDIKALLNISDISKDTILSLYIRRAETAITKYLNLTDANIDKSDALILLKAETAPESADALTEDNINITNYVELEYPDAICQFVVEAVNRKGIEGYTQFLQGSRQGMIETSLSNMVKSLLPLPYASMG